MADITDERDAPIIEADVDYIRKQAADMPKGKPGICDLCGEPSWRLVGGACAPCRDKFKLP